MQDLRLSSAKAKVQEPLLQYRSALIEELKYVNKLLDIPIQSEVLSTKVEVEDRSPKTSPRKSEKKYTRDDYYNSVVRFLLRGPANRRQISDYLNNEINMETTPDSVWGFLRRELLRVDSHIIPDPKQPGYYILAN